MKKVELHLHLDGSLRTSTVAQILNLDIEYVKNKMIIKSDNDSLSEYLTKFDLPIKAMQTKENLKRVASELAKDLKNDEVIYAEVRFAPSFHTDQGLTFDEVVESVLDGVKKVNGIKINVILCMMRGASYENNLKTIEVAEKYLNKGVVALDLAGDEKKYKTSDYEKLFDIAKKKSIPFTIHAGEAAGAESVLEVIKFGAQRIGHGIKIIENEKVLKLVREKNIFLEVCPTSNIQTKVVGSYNEHPIKKLYDNEILVTISTDNNTVSNISLSNEYNRLSETFEFTNKDFLQMNINAVLASFLSTQEKEKYIKILKEDYHESIHG